MRASTPHFPQPLCWNHRKVSNLKGHHHDPWKHTSTIRERGRNPHAKWEKRKKKTLFNHLAATESENENFLIGQTGGNRTEPREGFELLLFGPGWNLFFFDWVRKFRVYFHSRSPSSQNKIIYKRNHHQIFLTVVIFCHSFFLANGQVCAVLRDGFVRRQKYLAAVQLDRGNFVCAR